MNGQLKLVYTGDVSDELISEFIESGIGEKLQVEIVTQRKEDKYYNFSGGEISDIVIWVNQYLTKDIITGAIIGGVVGNFAYDLLKNGLKLLWSGLTKLVTEKPQKAKKINRISVRLMDKDKAIEIMLDGEVSEEQADKMIEAALEFARSENIDSAFDNPDYIPKETSQPLIRLEFNKDTQVWEPVNFGEQRRKWDEYQKWAREQFSS